MRSDPPDRFHVRIEFDVEVVDGLELATYHLGATSGVFAGTDMPDSVRIEHLLNQLVGRLGAPDVAAQTGVRLMVEKPIEIRTRRTSD